MRKLTNILRTTTLIAFITGLTFMVSHAQTTNPETETYTVKGTIVDAETEQVVENAEIQIQGTDITTVTGPEGSFILESLPAGDHLIVISAEGYEDWEKAITLDADKELEVKLQPIPSKE